MRSGQPLLTAAMIVRDEDEHLGGCLASLRDVVDEVVVVDTGSTDESVAIARSFGARVYREKWVDDFSRARNAALDLARGQWVLYIDADERLRPIARERVEQLLESAEEVAFRVLLRPFAGATASREFRLWRNDPRIRFEGIIHEKIILSIRAVARADGRSIGLCDLALDHLGYDSDQTRKHHRNLPLLRAQLSLEPRNVFNLRHLASVLAALGETDEAEMALEGALELVRAAPTAPSGGSLVYTDLARLRHARDAAGDLIDEAISRYPHDPLILWTTAFLELERGDAQTALVYFDRLAAVDEETLDDTLSFDERLFGTFLHEGRALSLFRLGRFGDAAVAYGAAERCEPENVEHRLKRVMCEHLAAESMPAGAERTLS